MKLLQFKASWCNPCKLQTKEFEENPLDMELQPIDVDDDNEDLATKYKVMSIPTMILLDKDTIVNKWVGFTKSEIINKYFSELNNKKDNETN